MIIPLPKGISWSNPPYVTIALILINIFIFIGIQNNDHRQHIRALDFYFDSGLGKIEIPLYLDYLEKERPKEFQKINKTEVENNPSHKAALFGKLNSDTDFLNQLRNDLINFPDSAQKKQHGKLRLQFEALENEIVSFRYGFRPAHPRPVTWLTHMFLHGGVGHLLGNMIFLWIIGCLIEYGCRRWIFLAIYGLGGLAAVGFFWLLHIDSLRPLVGASGAISGIMGAFTVLYGLKRVRVWFSTGFYFNIFRLPAIVFMPLWIGTELFQMVFNKESVVAYAAHLGGLVGGVGLAFAARKIPNLLNMDAFENIQDDPVQPLVEKALEHMGRLAYAEARELLAQADALQPENEKILQHLFTIDRQNPKNKAFHQTSRQLLTVLCRQPATYPQAHKVYTEYRRLAQTLKLSESLYLKLCQSFCDIEKANEAHQLIAVLVKKRSDLNGIPSLLLKLAGLHARKGNQKARQACLAYVCKQYPMSSEAGIAKQQLNPGSAK